MLDHMGFGVSDFARAKSFYEKALAPLGIGVVMEVRPEEGGHSALGLGTPHRARQRLGEHPRRIGLRLCRRCLIITEQKTFRRPVTWREIEQRIAGHPPAGYSFVSCNRKKHKAKFVKPSGVARFVVF